MPGPYVPRGLPDPEMTGGVRCSCALNISKKYANHEERPRKITKRLRGRGRAPCVIRWILFLCPQKILKSWKSAVGGAAERPGAVPPIGGILWNR